MFEPFVRILLNVNLFLNQTLCETNLDDSIDFDNFFVRGSFNPKGVYYSYVWSCSLCVGRTSFCSGLISRKLNGFLFIFSTDFAYSLSCFFFLCRSPSPSLCTVFDAISSDVGKVLSINPSAIVFVFGDFNIRHKDWLNHSGGTWRPSEPCYNFSISNDLTEMVNFSTRIPNCDPRSPALLDLFLLTLVFVLQWISFYWKIPITLLSQFPLTSRQTQNRKFCFII